MMAPDASKRAPTPTQRTAQHQCKKWRRASHPPPRTGIHFELDLRRSIQRIETVPSEIEVTEYLRFQAIETGIKCLQLSESARGAGVDEAVEKPYSIRHRPRLNPFVGFVFRSGTLTEHPRFHSHPHHAHDSSS